MRNVMKKAWEIAREGARKFGGSVKEYFAEALRMAWAIVKSEGGNIIVGGHSGLDAVLVLGQHEYVRNDKDTWDEEWIIKTNVSIMKETEKAIQVKIKWSIDYQDGEVDEQDKSVWLPKSQIEMFDNVVIIEIWLAKKNGITGAMRWLHNGELTTNFGKVK